MTLEFRINKFFFYFEQITCMARRQAVHMEQIRNRHVTE